MCEYKKTCKYYKESVCKNEYLDKCDQRKALKIFNKGKKDELTTFL